MFSLIIWGSVNNIVSPTKAIMETHVAMRHYKNYSERIIKRPH